MLRQVVPSLVLLVVTLSEEEPRPFNYIIVMIQHLIKSNKQKSDSKLEICEIDLERNKRGKSVELGRSLRKVHPKKKETDLWRDCGAPRRCPAPSRSSPPAVPNNKSFNFIFPSSR